MPLADGINVKKYNWVYNSFIGSSFRKLEGLFRSHDAISRITFCLSAYFRHQPHDTALPSAITFVTIILWQRNSHKSLKFSPCRAYTRALLPKACGFWSRRCLMLEVKEDVERDEESILCFCVRCFFVCHK